ncbi:MAG: sodium:proline symporter, partial [Oscillospiraceae bacterium]
ACIWVLITLTAAVFVGIFGYSYLNAVGNEAILATFNALGDSEKIFMFLSSTLLPSIIAGVILSAILAAIMSTADSQLLVTASAVTNDIFKLLGKNISDKTLMWISRLTVVVVAIIAFILAIDPNSSVMGLVSYAWAGLGAAFGPTIILSLFWKRMNINGAVAGMVSGGLMVVLWTSFLEASTGIYSLLPAFVFAFVMIIIVSLMSKKPPVGVEDIFEKASGTEI